MPDRRQGDRRENSSFLNKKIAISLSNFIFIIIITLIILASIVLCKFFNLKGYDSGYSDGYSDALYDMGYNHEIGTENNNSSDIVE